VTEIGKWEATRELTGEINQIRQKLEQEKGKFEHIIRNKQDKLAKLDSLMEMRSDIEQAQIIIQNVAQQTQQQLSWYINDMVSAAIEAIFPNDDYLFKLEFTQRRGRTEADMYLINKDGHLIKPSDSEGGGLINVVAFALRVALWSLSKSTRPVLLLDEPFHFLHSRSAHEKVSELLQLISEKLNLQIIMITGEDESEEIIGNADKVFRIEKTRGVSGVVNV